MRAVGSNEGFALHGGVPCDGIHDGPIGVQEGDGIRGGVFEVERTGAVEGHQSDFTSWHRGGRLERKVVFVKRQGSTGRLQAPSAQIDGLCTVVFEFQPFPKGPRLVVGAHSIGKHLAEANGGAGFNRPRFGGTGGVPHRGHPRVEGVVGTNQGPVFTVVRGVRDRVLNHGHVVHQEQVVVVVPQPRWSCEVNQPPLTRMQACGALGSIEHDGTGVEVGPVTQPIDDGPTEQINAGAAVVDQFHPLAIGEGVPVHGGVGKHFGELDCMVHAGLESDPVGVRLTRRRVGSEPPQTV